MAAIDKNKTSATPPPSATVDETDWEDDITHLYKVQDKKLETKAIATLPSNVTCCKLATLCYDV